MAHTKTGESRKVTLECPECKMQRKKVLDTDNHQRTCSCGGHMKVIKVYEPDY